MTTVLALLTSAHRAAGASSITAPIPAGEMAEVLTLYNTTVLGWAGSLIGPKLVSKRITASATAESGRHYLFSGASGITLTLATDHKAGARVGASGLAAGAVSVSASPFTVQGSSSVSVSGESRTWFFDGQGNWVREQDAVLTDDVVYLPQIHRAMADVFTALIARDYGLPVSEEMKALYVAAQLRIAAQYGGRVDGAD